MVYVILFRGRISTDELANSRTELKQNLASAISCEYMVLHVRPSPVEDMLALSFNYDFVECNMHRCLRNFERNGFESFAILQEH